jgi:hypothetical protein
MGSWGCGVVLATHVFVLYCRSTNTLVKLSMLSRDAATCATVSALQVNMIVAKSVVRKRGRLTGTLPFMGQVCIARQTGKKTLQRRASAAHSTIAFPELVRSSVNVAFKTLEHWKL